MKYLFLSWACILSCSLLKPGKIKLSLCETWYWEKKGSIKEKNDFMVRIEVTNQEVSVYYKSEIVSSF